MSDSPDWISCRAYAKHRGVTPMSVSDAIKAGRLVRSVVRDVNGQPKISSAELADQEWEANTDSSMRAIAFGGTDPRAVPRVGVVVRESDAPEGETVASATERLKSAQADLAEIKRDTEMGELVLASTVEHRLRDVFLSCRTRLLAIPSRARQALPHLTNADVVLIEDLVREACEDLAEANE